MKEIAPRMGRLMLTGKQTLDPPTVQETLEWLDAYWTRHGYYETWYWGLLDGQRARRELG